MNILIVDDETDVESLFAQRFRREIRAGQLTFAFAHSGEEALHYLDEHLAEAEAILILSDINMPGMSGLELLRRIKTNYPKPPPVVMMITAYGDDATHDQAMQYGADDFLNKPLDFAVLKQKILNRP